jgi:hypothetical protein
LCSYDGTALEEKLDLCDAIFIGPVGQCGYSTCLDVDQAYIIGTWIYDGGRAFVAGEYMPCITNVQLTNINAFLSAIGSGMSFGNVLADCGCSSNWTGVLNTSVPMLADVPHIMHACTNSVSGGTWLANINSPPGYPFIAMEAIGNGFVMAAGDSNLTATCGYNNCKLWEAFIGNDSTSGML